MNIPYLNCQGCGTEFRPASMVTARKQKFCSYSCNSIAQKKKQRNKGTRIEVAIKNALIAVGIRFKEQHVVPKVGIPDFYLPDVHGVIFCDGEYWHRLPGKADHDAWQVAELSRRGYRVMRFWEKEIKADPDGCVRQIQQEWPFHILDKLL